MGKRFQWVGTDGSTLSGELLGFATEQTPNGGWGLIKAMLLSDCRIVAVDYTDLLEEVR